MFRGLITSYTSPLPSYISHLLPVPVACSKEYFTHNLVIWRIFIWSFGAFSFGHLAHFYLVIWHIFIWSFGAFLFGHLADFHLVILLCCV
jgi:uncharacterized PurR-regulated membrane protein YhhQ (DUF165 family)